MSNDAITFTWSSAKNGTVIIRAELPGGESYTDKVEIADAKARAKFIRDFCKGRKGVDKKAVEAKLEQIAMESATPSGRPPSQADKLVSLAAAAELFHTPGADPEAYATVSVNGHSETWPVNSRGLKRWLSRAYWETTEKAPSSQALQDALNVLAGKAVHEGPEHIVAVRLAEHEGAIYLDLADDGWHAVKISRDGWQVISDPPVRFCRRRGMLPLPAPIPGGSIDELREFVNLPDDAAWILFVAWLIAALRPGRPCSILDVNGEQGSAKTTACRMARKLVDPNEAPLRHPPRNPHDLMIAASNGWIVGFDNVSVIQPWLSDALCSLATGGSLSTRELFTNGEEMLFSAIRPIILNGIEDLATRSDLLDRMVTITLPAIDDSQRRDEDDIWRRFEEARPRLLGALLDVVRAALRNLPHVRLASKPRMADFATWVVAAEPALPWPAGAFLEAYTTNRGTTNAMALEASIVGPAIFSLMAKQELWHGMTGELLNVLEADEYTDEKTRRRKDWPTSGRKLGGELRRLAPNLRRAGILVTFHPHTRRGNPVTLEGSCKTSSPPSPSSQGNAGKGFNGDEAVMDGDDRDESGNESSPASSRPNPLSDNDDDNGDDRDGVSHTQSGSHLWARL